MSWTRNIHVEPTQHVLQRPYAFEAVEVSSEACERSPRKLFQTSLVRCANERINGSEGAPCNKVPRRHAFLSRHFAQVSSFASMMGMLREGHTCAVLEEVQPPSSEKESFTSRNLVELTLLHCE